MEQGFLHDIKHVVYENGVLAKVDCIHYVTDKSLLTLEKSAEAAFNKYTEKDKELCLKLQDNRNEQLELQKRLEELSNQEKALENERDDRTKTQKRAELVSACI